LFAAVAKTVEVVLHNTPSTELDKTGYVNQHGLSRKVDAFVSFPRVVFCGHLHYSTFLIR
jgi:hypothetical protein